MKGGITMKKFSLSLVLLLTLLFSITPIISAAPSDIIFVVEVEGEINAGLYKYIEKNIDRAEVEGVAAIIFQINTFGGYVDSAIKIRDIILDTPILTAAFVKDRAWSAGSLITLACDRIYMTPESSMGAAETRPNEEKYISALRKEFKATAERQGRNPDIAAAMVDKDIEIEGVIKKDKLLTLTAEEAVELKMADMKVNTMGEILPLIGAENGVIKEIVPSLKDTFARLITNPYISSLLLSIGLIGLIVEAIIPGWGVGGTIGILALTAFFSGNLVVGNTSWGLILLFLAGMFLLGLEFFVVPGFGITGVGGMILVISSLFLTFEDPIAGIYGVSFSFVFALVIFIILLRRFGNSKMWNRIALNTTQSKENGYLATKAEEELLDQEGEALTTLRPAGIALIKSERVDVVSNGGYITQGKRIKVIKIEGIKVIVKEL